MKFINKNCSIYPFLIEISSTLSLEKIYFDGIRRESKQNHSISSFNLKNNNKNFTSFELNKSPKNNNMLREEREYNGRKNE